MRRVAVPHASPSAASLAWVRWHAARIPLGPDWVLARICAHAGTRTLLGTRRESWASVSMSRRRVRAAPHPTVNTIVTVLYCESPRLQRRRNAEFR
jgi:hypothetical protein